MKLIKLTPNFEVSNIKETVAFYSENFGFRLIMAVPETQDGIEESLNPEKEYVYALLQSGCIEIMIQRSDTFKHDVVFAKELSIGASVSFYMDIKGIHTLHTALKSKNIRVTDLKTTWYGMTEFYMMDLNGYILGFAEKIAE